MILIGLGDLHAAATSTAQTAAGSNRSGEAQPGDRPGLTLLYPFDETVFPPEIAPPTFRWQAAKPACDRWRISITFRDDLPQERGSFGNRGGVRTPGRGHPSNSVRAKSLRGL